MHLFFESNCLASRINIQMYTFKYLKLRINFAVIIQIVKALEKKGFH